MTAQLKLNSRGTVEIAMVLSLESRQGGDMLSRSRSLPLLFSVPTISFLPTERMQEVVNVNVHAVQGAVDLFTPLT